MRIGIIGAGAIGGTLARFLSRRGHEVLIANSRGPASLATVAKEVGATAVDVRDAAHVGEVVMVSIPFKAIPDLPRDLFAGVAEHVVVIDTNNYYPMLRDGRIDALESGMHESRWVAEQLGRPVIKAFNSIYAASLRERAARRGARGRIALPAAGGPDAARAVTLQLVDEVGFDPVDAGGLDESWRQQTGTPAYCRDLDADGLRRALGEADPGRLADYRRAQEDRVKRELGL